MPFMKGKAPIRRTLNYLNYGKLILKDQIKVFSINYSIRRGDHHDGAREFTFWHLPQIQYKNPNVQVITMTNLTPSPFIRCFYGKHVCGWLLHSVQITTELKQKRKLCFSESGRELLIDVDGKSKEEILEHCIKVVGKSA